MQDIDSIDHIDHDGVVVSTDPKRNVVTVRVDDKGNAALVRQRPYVAQMASHPTLSTYSLPRPLHCVKGTS